MYLVACMMSAYVRACACAKNIFDRANGIGARMYLIVQLVSSVQEKYLIV